LGLHFGLLYSSLSFDFGGLGAGLGLSGGLTSGLDGCGLGLQL